MRFACDYQFLTARKTLMMIYKPFQHEDDDHFDLTYQEHLMELRDKEYGDAKIEEIWDEFNVRVANCHNLDELAVRPKLVRQVAMSHAMKIDFENFEDQKTNISTRLVRRPTRKPISRLFSASSKSISRTVPVVVA